jgi:hypothetical protein
MTGKIIRFSDYDPLPRSRVRTEENALIIVLPVIRIERFDDAIAPVMGRPMRPGFARRLRNALEKDA